ncbi:MoxR family ATPase [Actinosynnema sp. NPDC047251]|uniref:ATPase central domain-containing protein n=1 Tax=Saccharothrix espanaensis (strain ATCC 51144 / DSM 44229 / JCM 9112 / NBRC 15066 / NRRL 15764) TaxID=1179773 RepID=K0KD93_SACES|nr:MoxR family ATPase [Saccharothrix espanaensis]CCH34759.1 ATPase central domain-containing protein [Saccharothrix espanaensis DSM 44229]
MPESGWPVYRGTGQPHSGIGALPPPPPWRVFDGEVITPPVDRTLAGARPGVAERATVYRPGQDVVEMVNAALYLRRPLLVTGKPGTGKSTLAFSVAHELKLGPVLYWPVGSHSRLVDGLYRYDAIGRLQEVGLHGGDHDPDIGRFVRLGPLGTALVPGELPRVLLVDELDKSDIDLPNDLLNVFEEGQFDIPELSRLPDDRSEVRVMTEDFGRPATIRRGRVRCRAFPLVVITSNGEREFPPALLRRCLRVDIQPPDTDKLAAIVAGHLGDEALAETRDLVARFVERRDQGDLATDQLLNAVYLAIAGARPDLATRERLVDRLLQPLDGPG